MPLNAVGLDSSLAEAVESLAHGNSPTSLATRRSPEGAIPRSRASTFHTFGSPPHPDIHHRSCFTNPRIIIQLTRSGNVASPVVGQRGSGRTLISGPRASGSAMPTRWQFRGQQSITIVVPLHMQPLTASTVGGGCSKNRLTVGFEELVTARSVRERYLVSLHHATVNFNAKQSCRHSLFDISAPIDHATAHLSRRPVHPAYRQRHTTRSCLTRIMLANAQFALCSWIANWD